MHARVSTTEVQPGRIDELVPSPEIRFCRPPSSTGFSGGLWLTDPDTNKVIIVTLWETKEDMEAAEQSGYYREQVGKFGGMLAGDVVREAYEVSIHA